MKMFIILFTLSFFIPKAYAQNEYGCGAIQFEKLTIISHKHSINNSDFVMAVKLLNQLEKIRCSDYTGKKNGREYVVETLTGLFGDICLKKNDTTAVKEYINYLNRQQGSAEEELSYQFERIFQKSPELVFTKIGMSKYLLDDIVWGFVNNHLSRPLTTKNYREAFFEYYPQLKPRYQQYKVQIDYLLNTIYLELEG